MARRSTKETNRQIILAAGVFDLLHLGHVKFLEEAKKVAGENGELIVIVARDKTVEQRKGEKPVMSENQRRALVESLKVVDEAILGYEEFNIGDVIMKIKPDVVVLGHDQESIGHLVKKIIRERSLNTKVQKIGKFSEDELNSSSEIKRKIIELYKRLQ
ncbi:MAG: FAD synthase [Candidatus Bathyarchaeota archaeon]|nr:MAG: FAD synthase [Candidatus Bathyarchaeota archaeon]